DAAGAEADPALVAVEGEVAVSRGAAAAAVLLDDLEPARGDDLELAGLLFLALHEGDLVALDLPRRLGAGHEAADHPVALELAGEPGEVDAERVVAAA